MTNKISFSISSPYKLLNEMSEAYKKACNSPVDMSNALTRQLHELSFAYAFMKTAGDADTITPVSQESVSIEKYSYNIKSILLNMGKFYFVRQSP